MTQKTIELLIRMWRHTQPTRFKAVYAPRGREWLSAHALLRRRYARWARGGIMLDLSGRQLAKWLSEP